MESARTLALLLLIAVAACGANRVDRARWIAMSPREKTIYMRSMIGHEEAKSAKGGNDRHFPLSADEYVRRIDAAYARGDRRAPATIFEEMGSTR